MNNHPHLKILYSLYKSEINPFRKVHRMIDLFESIIKTHTVVIMAEYFKRNEISDSAKGLLAAGLRTPSLGTWQLFSRELYKELKVANHVFLSDVFPEEFEDLDKALNNQKTNVISFRNGYAHGATPSDADCEKDINQFEPFLERLLSSIWLANTDIIEKKGKAILISLQNNDELSLHPLLIAKEEKDAQPFAFFNDLKDDKVGLLNYPLSKHYREKEFFSEFNSYLPLKEWKKNGNQQFRKNIEELTETFKGREIELKIIKDFIADNDKGFLCITGNPGIGKSSLIAQAFKLINTDENKDSYFLIEYFIKRGTAQARPDFLINYLQRVLAEGIKKIISPLGHSIEEKGDAIIENFKIWFDENPNQKLILLIDGLDEGVENGLLDFMPRQLFDGVLIIYGSRPGGHENLTKFWMELSTEKKKFLELKGLNNNDIRALLYEVTNKYTLQQTWIETIAKKSDGNPLYLKLLCESIEACETDINDEKALPSDIGRYYENFLNRYSKLPEGDHILQALYVIAAAHDYLSVHQIELILEIGEAESMRIMSILTEVLYDNPFTEEIEDWQLFHESFREYLKLNRSSKIQDAEQKIIKYCSNWESLNGKWEQKYTLMHYSKHLLNAIEKNNTKPQELYTLADNDKYKRHQIKTTNIYTHTFELIKAARNLACLNEDINNAIHFLVERLKEMFEETNTLPEMVDLVRQGDIVTALIKTKDWGEFRKLINYLLFIQELLFGESKTTEFKNEAIKSVLLAIEEMPVYEKMSFWNDVIPPIAVYRFDLELRKLNLNAKVIWQRTRSWRYSDFDNIISYNEFYSKEYSHLIWADIYNVIDYDELDTEQIASTLAKVLINLKIDLRFIENINNKKNLNFLIKAIEDNKLKFQSDSSNTNEILIDKKPLLNSNLKVLISECKANTSTKLELENTINLIFNELEKINLLETKFESGLEILKELATINQKDYCNSFLDLLITFAEAFEVKSIEFSSNKDLTYSKYTKDDALFLVLKLCIEFDFENYFEALLDKQTGIFKVQGLYLIAQYQIENNDYESANKYLADSATYLEDNFNLFIGSFGLEENVDEAHTKIAMSLFEIGKLKDAVRIARLNSSHDLIFKKMFAQCVRENNWTHYSNLHFEIFNYKDKISEQMGHHEYDWWNSKEYVEEILYNLLNSDKKDIALFQLKNLIENYENKGFNISFFVYKLKDIIVKQNDSELALSIIEIINTKYSNLLYGSKFEILTKLQENIYSNKFKKLYDEEFNKCYNSKDAYDIINASETLIEIGKFEDSLKLLNKAKQLELTTYYKEKIYDELIAHNRIEEAEVFLNNNNDLKEELFNTRWISYPDEFAINDSLLQYDDVVFSNLEQLNEKQKNKLVIDLGRKAETLFADNKLDFSIKILNLAISVNSNKLEIVKIILNIIIPNNLESSIEFFYKINSFSIREAVIKKIILFFIEKEDELKAKFYFDMLIDSYNSKNFLESIESIDDDEDEIWKLVTQNHFDKLDLFINEYNNEELIQYYMITGLILAYTDNLDKAFLNLDKSIYKIKDIGIRSEFIKNVSDFFMNDLKNRNLANMWMKKFTEPDDINLCLTGILLKTNVSEVDSQFLFEYLPFAYTNNLIKLLFKHAAWQCIYAVNPDRKIISEIETVLDISHYTCFLDDIKTKSSDNINEWLNDISDEDDKEQVILWAKQVSKGKLSEQDFLNNIKGIVNDTN